METSNAQASDSLSSLSQSMTTAVEKISPSIVAVDARRRVPTSGVIWRPDIIVSTNHTVRRDEEITITTHDGRNFPATLAGRDPSTDLAVLRFDGGGGTGGGGDDALATTDAAATKVGNLVLAVGRAHPSRGVTASLGIVSEAGGGWRTWRGGEIDRLIRPDISIFIGFSGGALVDAEGRVVGVNTTGLARGAALTIPAATVNRVVDHLLQHGRVARPYLGVAMQPVALPDDLRSKYNWPAATALMMLSVEPNAAAGQAGITLGDVLVALDGAAVADTDDVQAALGRSAVGQTITATILRGGERHEMTITLGERPSAKGK